MSADTIVARATGAGRGGVGVVRVSGPKTKAIAEAVLGCLPKPRYAKCTPFLSDTGEPIDDGLALFFEAPHSFTGEDVLELQGHGGMVVIDRLISRVLEIDGVRVARPGEFSERAFLNDKIDLVQAESIADLIDATSTQAATSAVRSLQGEFSKKIHTLVEGLIKLRLYVEAAIDFPEEEVDFLQDKVILESLSSLSKQMTDIIKGATQGALIRDGLSVVIAGRPNAGKSSLLNALSGRDSAIVTDIPGTTRDVLRELIHIGGMPLHVIDTAGLRESDDPVEQLGVARATGEINQADVVLLIIDGSQSNLSPHDALWTEVQSNMPVSAKLIVVSNKIDINQGIPRIEDQEGVSHIYLSAKTGDGVDLLCAQLTKLAGFEHFSENTFIARRRHLNALENAHAFLIAGEKELREHAAGELLAENCRHAQNELSLITGEFTPDDLLGEIFSSFCIGK